MEPKCQGSAGLRAGIYVGARHDCNRRHAAMLSTCFSRCSDHTRYTLMYKLSEQRYYWPLLLAVVIGRNMLEPWRSVEDGRVQQGVRQSTSLLGSNMYESKRTKISYCDVYKLFRYVCLRSEGVG